MPCVAVSKQSLELGGKDIRKQWRSQPTNLGEVKKFGVAKMFDFRRTTLFCLEKPLLKAQNNCVIKIWGGPGTPRPPLATPM